MATIGDDFVTFADLKARLDGNDMIDHVIELLADENEVMEDIPFKEGNLLTGEMTTVRTGLPTVIWRKLNQGVPRSKSRTKQLRVDAGMMEGRSAVDEDLVELNGLSAAFRQTEDAAFIEAMSQEFCDTLWYGDTSVNPQEFLGFDTQFNTPSTDDTKAGYNLVDGGAADGQTDTTSIYLVGWGPRAVHGIYPKGTKYGLTAKDLGVNDVDDDDGNPYRAYETQFKWKCGLVVKDWRYVVRIANLDVSALQAGSVDLVDLMIKAEERIRQSGSVKYTWNMNKTVATYLRLNMKNDAGSQLTFDTVGGKRVMAWNGWPVRRNDALLKTETAILDAAGTFTDA